MPTILDESCVFGLVGALFAIEAYDCDDFVVVLSRIQRDQCEAVNAIDVREVPGFPSR